MDEERYQKELFEFKKPRKSFFRLPKLSFDRGLDGNLLVTLTLEKVIFICIGIILFTVLIYALGVERGRALGKPSFIMDNRAKSIRHAQPVPVQREINRPYTIVAAAFRQKVNAFQLMNSLKTEGYAAAVMQSNTYYQVCIGSYPNKEGARELLNKVRQKYKSAYIKKR